MTTPTMTTPTMSTLHPAFTASLPLTLSRTTQSIHITTIAPLRCTPVPYRSSRITMQQSQPKTQATDITSSWPPADMTDDWAAAVERLSRGVPAATRQDADDALCASDGDEQAALQTLVETFTSEVQQQREQAVQRAREGGDKYRVSAIKEAELRRKATGSARDFFKGYVEIEGSYVDSGYVDQQADFMGNAIKGFKKLFGGK